MTYIYPNCEACEGLGHQNGCEVCHNSGVDWKQVRAMDQARMRDLEFQSGCFARE